MVKFLDDVLAAENRNNTFLCVGLDPDPNLLPKHLSGRSDSVFEFCKSIVDATHDFHNF